MGSYAVQPGARVVWCLRRRAADVQCLLMGDTVPIEVAIVHDGDLVISEVFQEEWMALHWAKAYAERLRAQGWQDVPGAQAAS